MRCPACGAVVGANARFCEQCGTRLQVAEAAVPAVGATLAARARPRDAALLPERARCAPSADAAARAPRTRRDRRRPATGGS